ncbi:MAG TPA: DUF1800 domain-containing protein [Rickettsiales bacterium]|nr:DUF1800 domain-containing protein [Rickettsiales bacterium]
MRAVLAGFISFALLFSVSQTQAAEVNRAQALHLLNRITYGPTPALMQEVERIGLGPFIEQQLHPEQIPPYTQLNQLLAPMVTTNSTLTQLTEAYMPPEHKGVKLTPEEKKAARRRMAIITDELREAKLLRAIYGPAQLQELMVDFWFNHFNVFEDKGADRILIGTYERDAIRPYAMGKFRDLLQATAKHPAMLFYLDNWLNTAPDSRFAKGKFKGLNENYAREIMELHTMGVDGGYTQQDVTTLARILTGWGFGVGKGKDKAERVAEFEFDPRRHDYSTKEFLGHTIRGTGADEVEQAIDILTHHPSTAHHIAYEIAQYFVADEPPESLVQQMAATFTRTDGDIRAVLSTMLYSKEFWDPQYAQNKFKPPLRFVVSAVRLSTVPLRDMEGVEKSISTMGEPLYHYLTPDGYPATNERWMNSDALLRRIGFAKELVNGRFSRKDSSGMKQVPDISADAMLSVFGSQFSPQSRSAVDKADGKLKPVMILSSPEVLYY